MFSGSSPKSTVIKIMKEAKTWTNSIKALTGWTTTEWIMLDDFFQIVLPLCASFSIFLLQFSFHKGMHNKFHKMFQKMFQCVFSPQRICMNNIVFPKLGWPQLCKWIMTWIYISTMNEWMDSIKVNCTSGIEIVFKTNFCDVMWCSLAAASGKQSSSAGCHNGSTILAIRTDKVTHEWINDYKMPTSPPCWNQPSWRECSVPKHCPGKTNWDS